MKPHHRLLDILPPIVQAPMAGVQNHRLAASVCEAGGLGSLPAAMLSLPDLQSELQALHQSTQNPYNVNFFCHAPPAPDDVRQQAWHRTLAPYYRELGLDPETIPTGPGRVPFSAEAAHVLEVFRPAVVSFHFGLPSPELVARVKSWGSLVLSSATTVAEALWLQAHGADAIIAQGLEAGGHRGMFLTDELSTQLGTFALLPQIDLLHHHTKLSPQCRHMGLSQVVNAVHAVPCQFLRQLVPHTPDFFGRYALQQSCFLVVGQGVVVEDTP